MWWAFTSAGNSFVASVPTRADAAAEARTTGTILHGPFASQAAARAWLARATGRSPAPPPPAGKAPASGVAALGRRAAFIAWLMRARGTPYLWGGQNPFAGGADCAGLIRYCAGRVGIAMPAGTIAQFAFCQVFHDPRLLVPGDLIFMTFPGEVTPGHVAAWLGGNQVIQDSQPGVPVAVASFDPVTGAASWGATLNGYARIPGIGSGPAGALPPPLPGKARAPLVPLLVALAVIAGTFALAVLAATGVAAGSAWALGKVAG